MKNSEEQNIGFLLQCFKLCGEFTPFPLQPGLINVQNVVFRFSASNKETSICSEHCGAGPACHPQPAILTHGGKLRPQQNSQQKKGRNKEERVTARSPRLSPAREGLLPTSVGH